MSKRINYNQAIGTSFKLEIPTLREITYFVQTAEIPGLSMSGVDSPYQKWGSSVPSNRVEYDPFNFTFLVDEDFANWDSLRTWMLRIRDTEPVVPEMMDVTLHILNSNKNSIRAVKFRGAYPTMVSAIPMESSTSDATPLVCSATLRFQEYEFIRHETV